MKKLIYIILTIIIAAIIGFIVFFDTIAKNIAEKAAAKTLNTEVTISEIKTNLLDYQVDVMNIRVANPSGFKNSEAFSLRSIYLDIDNADDENIILVKNLSFDGIQLTLEQDNTRVNLYSLYDNLAKASDKKAKQSKKYADKGKGYDKKVIIESLNFTNLSVFIDTQWLKETIKIPDIKIRDFGKSTNGIAVYKVGTVLMDVILEEIKKVSAAAGLKLGKKKIEATVRKEIEKEVQKVKKQIEEKVNEIKKKVEEKVGSADVVDKLKENIGKSAKDLLKNIGF